MLTKALLPQLLPLQLFRGCFTASRRRWGWNRDL